MRSLLARKFLTLLLCGILVLDVFMSSVLSLVFLKHHGFNGGLETALESNDELELIKIPIENIGKSSTDFFKLNEHEFVYHNKLYDVIRSYSKDGFLYYYCFNDSKEEELLAQIRECTVSHLDWFSSGRSHGALILFKVFAPENSITVLADKKLPETCFVFSEEITIFYSYPFLVKVYSPPENFIC